MKKRVMWEVPGLAVLGLMTLGLTPLFAQQEMPRGAKELFFDPVGTEILASTPADPCSVPGGERCERRRVSYRQANFDNLGLSYWIEFVEGPEKKGREVTASRIFKSGEKIRLHFLSNRDGLISLLQLGTSGAPSMLFPDPGKGMVNNLLRAGKERILPAEEAWFRFDDNVGTERLIVVFATDQEGLDTTLYPEPRQRRYLDSDLVRVVSDGSKDLVLETEEEARAEIGTYAVNTAGKPIVLEIALRHE